MLIFSSQCRRPLRLLRYGLFTNCQKCPETIRLASKCMGPTFWVVLSETRATEYLKRLSCFSGQNVSSRTEKPSLIPISGFRGRFSINGTDLYIMVNAIPGRNLPVLNSSYYSTPTVNRPVLPMQMVNNHDFPL